jgi:hypothetical protein
MKITTSKWQFGIIPQNVFRFAYSCHRPDVQITFVLSGSRDVKEDGRIQLWLPKSPQCRTTISESTADVTTNASQVSVQTSRRADLSKNASRLTLAGYGGGSSRGLPNLSRASLHNITPVMNSSKRTFLNVPSIASPTSTLMRPQTASSLSGSGSTSQSSVSAVSTGSGTGYLHSKPRKPMLVLYLKSKDQKGTLSIVTVQIDDQTFINSESCHCNRKKSTCLISAIERRKNNLLAQRYVADQGLNSWDIAAIGTRRRQELPVAAWAKLKRISIKFKQVAGESTATLVCSPWG